MTLQSYQDLVCGRRNGSGRVCVIARPSTFHGKKVYSLTAQVRRAARIDPAPISPHDKAATPHRDFPHFLSIARGSVKEVEHKS